MREPGGEWDQHSASVVCAGEHRARASRGRAVDTAGAYWVSGEAPGHGGLPLDLVFRTKGQPTIDICTEAFADGVTFDFVCEDEVYGSCIELREFLKGHGQGYVLRVPSNFHLTLAAGTAATCAQAAHWLRKVTRRQEILSAGKGSKGTRRYSWAQIDAASPRHCLLARRHLKTGELTLYYCYVPEGQPLTMTRPIRTAELRWPAEEDSEFSASLLKNRTDTQEPPPIRLGQPLPPDPGLIPLALPEIKHLLAPLLARPPGHAAHWLDWRRRHQAPLALVSPARPAHR